MANDLKPGMPDQVSDVFATAGEETVQTNDLVPLLDQPIAEVASQKSGSAGYENRMLLGEVAERVGLLGRRWCREPRRISGRI